LAVLAMVLVATLTGSADLVPGLWVLVAAVPLILLREGIRRFCFARLRIGTAIAIDTTFCFLQLASIAALWYFGHLSVPALFIVMGAASGFACCGWLLFKPGRPLVSRDRLGQDWKQNWSFAKWAVLSYLAVDTIPYMMPWIIGIAAGVAATGLFGGCATLLGATNILVHGAGNYLRPKAAHAFAAGGVGALRHVLISVACLFAAAFGLLSLGFIVTGDWLAVLVYGAAFGGTAGVLIALSFNVMVGSLGFVASSGLWALGQPRSSLLADICMLVATLVAAAFLVVPYGPLGAAVAALIGTSLGTVVKILTVHWMMESMRTEPVVAGCHFVPENL
jgi:O-antigen/teichoic acid export membrane protein